MPDIQINFIAIIVAVVAMFIFGFLWYTPIFGKAWAKEMGMDPNEKPDKGLMMKGMISMVIGNFLLVWVFSNNMAVWDPTTWGHDPAPGSPMGTAFMAAFFTWLGFFFPVDLGSIFWEKKSTKLFTINTSYHFLSLLLVAMILVFMG